MRALQRIWSLSSKYPEHVVKAVYTTGLFTKRLPSFVKRRMSVVAACSACNPGEGVSFAAVGREWRTICSPVEDESVSPKPWDLLADVTLLVVFYIKLWLTEEHHSVSRLLCCHAVANCTACSAVT